MLVRQVDAANVVKARQYHHHFLGTLDEIKRPRHRHEHEFENADRPATRMRGENGLSGEDKLVALADLVTRPGLEDGIVGIANGKGRLPAGNAESVVGNVRMRRVLPHWSGTARRRDELAGICEPPDTWIGREIWRRHARSYRRDAQAHGQVKRAGETASREVPCMSGHRTLLCATVNQ